MVMMMTNASRRVVMKWQSALTVPRYSRVIADADGDERGVIVMEKRRRRRRRRRRRGMTAIISRKYQGQRGARAKTM
jgi:hypothetical protein